jgi:hypothetical protein
MIATKMYKRLAKILKNSRKSLWEVCEELNIDYDSVDLSRLGIDQCTHCDLWTDNLTPDLDENPICFYCKDIEGM